MVYLGGVDISTINITRPREVQAICPECGRDLRLPEDWQTIMRASMDPVEALKWDGVLRCKGFPIGHAPTPMVTRLVRNVIYEADGSVLVHLVTEDREHAECTGEVAGSFNAPHGTLMRQCQACLNVARRGAFHS